MKRRGFFKAFAGLVAAPAVAKAAEPKRSEFDAELIRERVMPEITKALETGVRGYREKWTEIFKKSA